MTQTRAKRWQHFRLCHLNLFRISDFVLRLWLRLTRGSTDDGFWQEERLPHEEEDRRAAYPTKRKAAPDQRLIERRPGIISF